LYSNRTIPKWHYLWHCLQFVLLHGNLWQHGCWKGESLIRIFKRWAQRLTSKNPMVQMARMYARKVAVQKFFQKPHCATTTSGLCNESTLDTNSDLWITLRKDAHIQASLDAPEATTPLVSWFKTACHLSDPVTIGSSFLSASESGAHELRVVQSIIKVCGQVFLIHQPFTSGTMQGGTGQHVLMSSTSQVGSALNLALGPITCRLVSIKQIRDKVCF